MSEVRVGDIWEYRGRRPRKALRRVSVVEAKPLVGRYRLLHTYRFGPTRERRTWIIGATLREDYRLVMRQEVLT
jgi:hypothetical protein